MSEPGDRIYATDDDVMRAILDAVQTFNIATAPDAWRATAQSEYDAVCSAKDALEHTLDAIGAALALRSSQPN
jgi:hypothetical protein